VSPIAATIVLLIFSNIFMTFAWYGHLRNLASSPWVVAALCLCGAVYFVFRGVGA